MNKEISLTGDFQMFLLTFLFIKETFLFACTKDYILLYKTIHSFVQKI